MKNQQIFYTRPPVKLRTRSGSIGPNKFGQNLWDGRFKTVLHIVILHQSKGRHWVSCIDQNYFDSYARSSAIIDREYILKSFIWKNSINILSINLKRLPVDALCDLRRLLPFRILFLYSLQDKKAWETS